MVFIRAPIIEGVGPDVEVLAEARASGSGAPGPHSARDISSGTDVTPQCTNIFYEKAWLTSLNGAT